MSSVSLSLIAGILPALVCRNASLNCLCKFAICPRIVLILSAEASANVSKGSLLVTSMAEIKYGGVSAFVVALTVDSETEDGGISIAAAIWLLTGATFEASAFITLRALSLATIGVLTKFWAAMEIGINARRTSGSSGSIHGCCGYGGCSSAGSSTGVHNGCAGGMICACGLHRRLINSGGIHFQIFYCSGRYRT